MVNQGFPLICTIDLASAKQSLTPLEWGTIEGESPVYTFACTYGYFCKESRSLGVERKRVVNSIQS
jgi:hypothetical protein